MSNNKQSSVEYYSNEIGKITAFALSGKITGFEWSYLQRKAFEQAKAMHKEEIIDAWDNAAIDATYGNKFSSAEQYYNETFGGNK